VVVVGKEATLVHVRVFAQRARRFNEGVLLDVAAQSLVTDPSEEQNALSGRDVEPPAFKGDTHVDLPSWWGYLRVEVSEIKVLERLELRDGVRAGSFVIASQTSAAGRSFFNRATIPSSCSIDVS
jgi:hypothetical protein